MDFMNLLISILKWVATIVSIFGISSMVAKDSTYYVIFPIVIIICNGWELCKNVLNEEDSPDSYRSYGGAQHYSYNSGYGSSHDSSYNSYNAKHDYSYDINYIKDSRDLEKKVVKEIKRGVKISIEK